MTLGRLDLNRTRPVRPVQDLLYEFRPLRTTLADPLNSSLLKEPLILPGGGGGE
jgi:hypothetical protein